MTLISLTVTVFTSFLVDVIKFSARITEKKEVQQNSRLIVSRISHEIKTARQIVSLAAGNITIKDAASADLHIYLDPSDQIIYFDNGIETIPINDSAIKATELDFVLDGDNITFTLGLEKNLRLGHIITPYQYILSSTVLPRSTIY